MWRIDGIEGRYLEYDEDGADADPETREALDRAEGGSVPVTPTGPFYRERGDDDPVWLFLAGISIVPGPLQIRGITPGLPSAGPVTPGAAY